MKQMNMVLRMIYGFQQIDQDKQQIFQSNFKDHKLM